MRLQELSGTEASPAPRFYVWAHMFLSNETPLHVITCRSPQMLLLHKFEQAGGKKRLIMVREEGQNGGVLNTVAT